MELTRIIPAMRAAFLRATLRSAIQALTSQTPPYLKGVSGQETAKGVREGILPPAAI